jgi:hypothetical protein
VGPARVLRASQDTDDVIVDEFDIGAFGQQLDSFPGGLGGFVVRACQSTS